MGFPSVIVNFKVYSEVEGRKALTLAKICEKVAEESGANIVVCPPMLELSAVAASCSIPVFSQNVDPRKPGSGTGFTTPSSVAAAGCAGTLVNHSEHKQSVSDVGTCVSMSKDLGLCVCVCSDTAEGAKDLAAFHPHMIAVEPPELIGGDVSVTTANPKIVSDTVDTVHSVDKDVAVLCGAGVKNGRDVRTALDLGASGVLLASGVVKAKDPESVIRDLISLI
ncbi:MAG: triose-phosphate isomerase [Candidatus Methanomethylophilaceae archaeon]|nr:triose-phosphate isomerase [Candidatus Methanomethylophilaceae archaeon]